MDKNMEQHLINRREALNWFNSLSHSDKERLHKDYFGSVLYNLSLDSEICELWTWQQRPAPSPATLEGEQKRSLVLTYADKVYAEGGSWKSETDNIDIRVTDHSGNAKHTLESIINAWNCHDDLVNAIERVINSCSLSADDDYYIIPKIAIEIIKSTILKAHPNTLNK